MSKRKNFYPLVSIVIPVYNGQKYLACAIDSALSQTYRNIEVLVIDDGSTDKTPEICASYGKKIRYLKKKNGGVATALNYGIDNMKGDYFSWLSHDDLYHKDKIMVEINELSKLKDPKSLITCGWTRIDENGKSLDDSDSQPYIVEISKYTDKQLQSPLFALLKGGCIFGCSLLIHKSHFERVGKFNPALLTNDYDLWFRMMRNSKLYFVREQYAFKRIHKEQDTNTKSAYISAAWFAYFIYAVTRLDDEEFNFIYESREKFFDFILQNIGLEKDLLKKVFDSNTREEMFYLILNAHLYQNYTSKINNLENELMLKNEKISRYESRLCFKIKEKIKGLYKKNK